MRTAIINPWYVSSGGAEKVDGVLAEMFPDADFFALFYKPSGVPVQLRNRKIQGSFLQRVPKIEKVYRPLLALQPYAVESFDLRGYDLVISSDWTCVKGVLTDQNAIHICYCHSPMRHVWDLYRTYLDQAPAWQRPIFAWTAHHLRQWDYQAAQRVDFFIANSNYIAERIQKYYGRNSAVIYPAVDTSRGYISEKTGDYYLSVGRLNRTKRLDLLIEACNRLGRKLVVAGWGPEETSLKSIAGPTVDFRGRVPDKELDELYANCKAFLFAANEDFGIVSVEAQAFGRPVVALGYGGSLETVRVNDPKGLTDSGVFFDEQTIESVISGIRRFEDIESRFVPADIQTHARKFDTSIFMVEMKAFLDKALRTRRTNALLPI